MANPLLTASADSYYFSVLEDGIFLYDTLTVASKQMVLPTDYNIAYKH